MGDARDVGRIARIGHQLRHADRLAQPGKLPVIADRQDHVAIGGRKVLIRDDVRVRVAGPHRRRAGGQVVHRLVGQARHLHVEQRQIDVLPLPGPLAMGERGQDRGRGIEPGQHVGQRHAHFLRPGARLPLAPPGHAHQPAHALDQEIVARPRRIRAGLAETCDRAIDQPRVLRPQRRLVEPIGGQPADLEVLDQHVALGGERLDQALPLRTREIDRHRPLVAIGTEIIGGVAGVPAGRVLDIGRPPDAGVVAGAGPLDLEHVGAVVAEQLPGPGPGEDAGKIEHLQVRQRSGRCHRPSLADPDEAV